MSLQTRKRAKAIYHTSLPDQFLRPAEATQTHASHAALADKAFTKFQKQLLDAQTVVYDEASVRHEAFIRHVHEVVDRTKVYSLSLSDVDRVQALDTLDHALHLPRPTGVECEMGEMEVDTFGDEPVPLGAACQF